MTGEQLAQWAAATETAIALLRRERRIEDVAPAVLERLAHAVRCEWGAYWTLDARSLRLQVVASWSALGSKGERFEQNTRVRTLAPNEGNAGHVWRSRKPIWTTNIVLDMCLPRSLAASEAGLRAGVWFAVKTDTAIHGVIELLARTLPYKNPDTVLAVERAGFRLGCAIEELPSEPSRLH